jgi:hypothetical protein
LLSLRGRGGDDGDGPPSCLVDLEDDVVVSKASQDPGEMVVSSFFFE